MNKLKPNKTSCINFNSLNEGINKLEEILKESISSENIYYKKWYQYFKLIYGAENTNLKLYITFALIYFSGIIFIFNYYIKKNQDSMLSINTLQTLKEYQEIVKKETENLDLINFDYFEPFNTITKDSDCTLFTSLIFHTLEIFLSLDVRIEFKFDSLYQNLISTIIRHQSGEFFTPPFLVKRMVKETYTFGDSVLDPCCGSGNFLVEIIKVILGSDKAIPEKISALNKIYGYDINPISIFITKINFIILLNKDLDSGSKISFNLYSEDSLFNIGKLPKKKFDLVISNPPWYTLRDIKDFEQQKRIKYLAEKLEIKPRPKNVLNIEIASLFFYVSRENYMKERSKIFFVITKGVITGSHASRFRNFNKFKSVKIWKFDKNIEKIFNIDFLCLYAEKSDYMERDKSIEIPTIHFSVENPRDIIDYFSDIKLIKKKLDILVPYHIEQKGDKKYVHKLISKELVKQLIPTKISCYKELFHKGADLNPRNLIFVQSEKLNDSLVKINPDERIFKRAKIPWDQKEYNDDKVESKYIFNVVKSTELVKFDIYGCYQVFLPLSKEDLSFNYDLLAKYSKNFYDKINTIYLNKKKETTKHNSLMDNLNRWAKLINKRQISKIKVVYNNSGSILNSAVIQGDFLITGDLSFLDTDNLNEAHYLSAILNSRIMAKQIQIKKSSRHIFKIPFETPIEKYNNNNQNHLKLVELGKKGQTIVKSTLNDLKKKDEKLISKIKIQGILKDKLNSILNQIDDILSLSYYL